MTTSHRPWQEHFRLGVVHPMLYPSTLTGDGPVLESLATIVRDCELEAIEIAHINGADTRRLVRDMLAASGVHVTYACQAQILREGLDLGSLVPRERQKALERVQASMSEAVELGADTFAVMSGPDPGPQQRVSASAQLANSLRELCDYAKNLRPLTIVLENYDRTIDKKALLGPTREATALVSEVRKEHANFGLMLDLSHLPMLDENGRESLREAKNVLSHVHIGNCVIKNKDHPAYGDAHPQFGIRGGENGLPEVQGFLEGLLEIGYLRKGRTPRPIVSIEVRPQLDEKPATLLADAKSTVREAWTAVHG